MKNLNKNYKKAFSLVEISIVILIIGLLIAGISKAGDMIFDVSLKSASSLTKGAKVGRMANLALWLETTANESIVEKERYNDTTITVWRDINPQTNSKFIFKNGGAAKYIEKGQNNLPAIGKFLTSSDLFLPYTSETSASVASYQSAQIFPSPYATIFAVVKPKAVATNLINFCPYDTSAVPLPSTTVCATGKEISLGLNATGNVVFNFMSASAASTSLASTNAYASRNLIVISAYKDTANQRLLVNGTDLVSASTANTYATTNSYTGTFRVGGGNTSTDVEIYEIIVFSSALNTAERQIVEAYLGKKYNVKMTATANP